VRTSDSGSGWYTRIWDLDVVQECGEWRLLLEVDQTARTILDKLLADRARGTAVLWRRLHRFDGLDVNEADEHAQKQFYDEVRAVESLLDMVFGRFRLVATPGTSLSSLKGRGRSRRR
jgi:hypothetical protein